MDIANLTEVKYDVRDHVATITLSRPERLNAITPTMEQELRAAMFEAESDENVRAIILTGEGRGFCAGADMKTLSALQQGDLSGSSTHRHENSESNGPRREDIRPDYSTVYSYFPSILKPIIGAINGPAAGLGFVISLYCDFRVASDQAKFSTSFSRRGLIAEHGVSWLLPRLIGMGNALDLLFSARVIEANEAHQMGLVNRVFPHNIFAEAAFELAREIATMVSPRSIRIMKQQVYDAQFQSLAEAIKIGNYEMVKSFVSEDFKEGVAHFIEKRAPAFSGR